MRRETTPQKAIERMVGRLKAQNEAAASAARARGEPAHVMSHAELKQRATEVAKRFDRNRED